MSFDNHYPNRKDHRKPYYRSGRFDRSCRPGGRCPACISNRLFRDTKQLRIAMEKLLEASPSISSRRTVKR